MQNLKFLNKKKLFKKKANGKETEIAINMRKQMYFLFNKEFGKETEIDKEKTILEKYIFYFERYNNSLKA